MVLGTLSELLEHAPESSLVLFDGNQLQVDSNSLSTSHCQKTIDFFRNQVSSAQWGRVPPPTHCTKGWIRRFLITLAEIRIEDIRGATTPEEIDTIWETFPPSFLGETPYIDDYDFVPTNGKGFAGLYESRHEHITKTTWSYD